MNFELRSVCPKWQDRRYTCLELAMNRIETESNSKSENRTALVKSLQRSQEKHAKQSKVQKVCEIKSILHEDHVKL